MQCQWLPKTLILIYTFALAVSGARGATPVTTNASPEARALLNFIYAMYGKKTLAGQMYAPWGIDEIQTMHEITGKYPAIRGEDYINERANKRENQLAIEWGKAGGIPTIMWHWGAPTKGEGYNQSKMTIDIDRCFEPGTPEHTAMWSDFKRIADHLTELRDAQVPILWRPMHECGTRPDPEECFQQQITWSWWMLWHTSFVTNHNREALIRAYNSDWILTRDRLPNIMSFLNVGS